MVTGLMLGIRIPVLEQRLFGVALLGATLFTDTFAGRDFLWLFQRTHLRDIQPWGSAGVLAVSPYLVLLAWRLMLGKYARSESPTTGGYVVLGVGLIGLAVLTLVGLPILLPGMTYYLAALGVLSLWLAWRRHSRHAA